MARKVRRVRKSRKARAESSAAANSGDSATTFEEEYAYVFRDLRRVFLLAAIMFALLIALNLGLR